jgi:hypothetical protein
MEMAVSAKISNSCVHRLFVFLGAMARFGGWNRFPNGRVPEFEIESRSISIREIEDISPQISDKTKQF